MAGVNGFSLEISADTKGFNKKLGEARKVLENLKREAATVNIGGGLGGSNASTTTATRKVNAGLMTMSAALDSATRALMHFSAAAGSASMKGTAASMQAATASASTRNGKTGKSAIEKMSLAGFMPNPAILTALGAVPLYKGLREYGQREKLRVDLGTLLQSDERGADMAARIQRYAASTPYSQNNLAGTAKTLLQYGVNETDTEKYMKQLGDIAMGNGQQMSQLGLVLGQVKAADKLQGQDLLQFINAGFNPLAILSDMTGQSIGDLKKLASEGAITFKDIAAALEYATSEGKKFYKGAERGSKTLEGLTSTIADNIGTALNDIVASQEDNLKKLADSWAKFDWGQVVSAGSDLFELTINGFSRLSEVMQAVAEHEEVIKHIFLAMESAALAMVEYKAVETWQNFNKGLADAAAEMGNGATKLQAFTSSAAAMQLGLTAVNWAVQNIVRAAMALKDLWFAREDAKKFAKEQKERSNAMEGLRKAYNNYKNGVTTEERYKSVYDVFQNKWGGAEGTVYNIWNKPEESAKKGAKGAQKQVYIIDKSKKEVKQTNNIKVDESRFARVVKDNLEMLLTSHFKIDNDLTAMQANAG